MRIDMHLCATRALAGAAGIPANIAKAIAWTSQFVDDNEYGKIVPAGEKAIVPLMTSHKPIDYKLVLTCSILDVWPFFHFPPGNLDASTFMERMRCVKNGPLVRAMVEHALEYKAEPFGPYFAGIVAHLLFDSWAHEGFIGLYTPLNKIKNTSLRIEVDSGEIEKHIWEKFAGFMKKEIRNAANIVIGTVAETAAPIGHAPVYVLPDEPYIRLLKYETEDDRKVSRNNTVHFLEAAECLFEFFIEFTKDNPLCGQPIEPLPWDSLSGKIRELLEQNGSLEERVKRWEKAIFSGQLCPPDRPMNYSPVAWSPNKIPDKIARGIPAKTLGGLWFIYAARRYRDLFLQEMVKHDLIVQPF